MIQHSTNGRTVLAMSKAIWSIALIGQVLVPLVLLWEPSPQVVPLLALWQGITGAVMWIVGISLIQMVPSAKKGLANGLMLSASTLFCRILIGGWGQHPGRFEHDPVPGWGKTLNDMGRLVRISRFWALVITLCRLGGPVFQASNQFLPDRAEDLGPAAARRTPAGSG